MSTRVLCAVVLETMLLACAHAQRADDAPGPSAMKWGALTVRTIPRPENAPAGAMSHLRIEDKSGRVLADLKDVMVAGAKLRKLNGNRIPDLEVNMFSGGAHCCYTNYLFTQNGGFHRLLDLPGGQVEGIAAVQDYNHDGRAEIIMADNQTWAYYGDLPFAFCPSMALVIGWDGHRYVNQTARFPQRSLASAVTYQASLLATLHKSPKDDEDPEIRLEIRHGAALGYFANMLAVNRAAVARTWLTTHAPLETRQWLASNEPDIRRTVALWSKTVYSTRNSKQR
jgi:hypothetical protein